MRILAVNHMKLMRLFILIIPNCPMALKERTAMLVMMNLFNLRKLRGYSKIVVDIKIVLAKQWKNRIYKGNLGNNLVISVKKRLVKLYRKQFQENIQNQKYCKNL